MNSVETYIGIGSNLNDPITQVTTAIVELADLPHTTLLAKSSLYRTKPLGDMEQPDFINAVVKLTTQLLPQDLLLQLQALELLHKRKRVRHWGPRTLDLDILLYGNEIIHEENLQIPHPGLKVREFVLYPLAEIAPKLCLPTGEALQQFFPFDKSVSIIL